MMNWLRKFRFQYVGAVEAHTRILAGPDETTFSETWLLLENGYGHRRTKKIGNATYLGTASQFAISRRAEVQAWLRGGPMPQNVKPAPPRPRKAKLISINGGKS